ncbi:polysaccharide deacetylase family protein [Bacteroides sp. 224]|uniref:polysaccharide deacetylase family protein n=1 Tax=Bacteroides sp. 224 TaxID=2302936 RepID=UPI001EF1B335|nr:polysaccharide deacetylase family protein [Bacteroides sp. 224]
MFKVLNQILDLSSTGFRVAKYKDDKDCAISYTFDDGLIEHYTLVAPRMEKLGFRGTFWINGNKINKDATAIADTTRMTWAQLKEMSDRGHEISNHGWAHKNFSRFPLEEIKEDIYKNDSALFAWTGKMPRTFCYPNNNKKAEPMKIAVENRVGTRTFQRSIGSKSTPEDLEKWVNNLIKTNDWGVGMTHGITYGYDAFRNPQRFWDHLEKVKALDDKVWVGTFEEVAAYTKEQKQLTYEITPQKKGFTITPHLSLEKSLFTEPLTGVVMGSKKVTVRQGGKKLKTQVRDGKVLFDFDPFGGEIVVR